MGQEDNFVTVERCEGHRREMYSKNNKQDVAIGSLQTDVSFVKVILFAILGTLVTGFAGTIFTLLKVFQA